MNNICYLDSVRLLVELGVSINQSDSGGVTPLHIACSHNYLDLACLLLQAHANADARTKLGRTSLHLAAMRGNIGQWPWAWIDQYGS